MKIQFCLFLIFISFISCEKNKTPIEVVTCLFQSEKFIEDVNKIIALVKEGDLQKLILSLLEMYPSIYEEFQKCFEYSFQKKFSSKEKCKEVCRDYIFFIKPFCKAKCNHIK